MGNKNIYDGCGIISSEILKKSFEGFEQGKVVNLKEGTLIPFDIEKYIKELKTDGNNFDRFLDKDRITKCNLDLDLFQFESTFDKRKCEKFIPKDIYELSVYKSKPIGNK